MPTFPQATNKASADEWLFDMRMPSGKTYSVYILDGIYMAEGKDFDDNIEAESIGRLMERVIE